MSLIEKLYRDGKLTARDIWARVDAGKLTAEQATKICGARPT